MTTVYRYKHVISLGPRLDCDLDDLGREGWKCISFSPLYRKIPGSLGSEQGISPDQTQTYVYLFVREIGPHSFEGTMPKLSQGSCKECAAPLLHSIHYHDGFVGGDPL